MPAIKKKKNPLSEWSRHADWRTSSVSLVCHKAQSHLISSGIKRKKPEMNASCSCFSYLQILCRFLLQKMVSLDIKKNTLSSCFGFPAFFC